MKPKGRERKAEATSARVLNQTSTQAKNFLSYFFELEEVEGAELEDIEHVQQLIDDLESGYYETADEEERDAFEITLEYINRRGNHLRDASDATLHCFAGVLRGDKLSFTHTGSPHALLFYTAKEKTERMELLGGANDEKIDHLFPSVMQGTMNPNDQLFVGTPHITEYFSYDRLEKIIGSRSSRQSMEHIQKVLEDMAGDISFGGILLSLLPKTAAPKTGRQPLATKHNSAASIDHLISTQKRTAETLSPPLLGHLKKNIGDYVQKKKEQKPNEEKPTEENLAKTAQTRKHGTIETNYRYREAGTDQSFGNKLLIGVGKLLITVLIGLGKAAKTIGISIGKLFLILLILLTNKNNGRRDMAQKTREYIERKRRMFGSLSLIHKLLLIATVIFAALFIGSLVFLKIKEQREVREQAYRSTVETIEQKIAEAESGLIYNDTEKAMQLLHDAQALTAALPNNTKEQKEKTGVLNASIDEKLMTLRKIAIVETAIVLDATTLSANGKIDNLTQIGSLLIAFGSDDPLLYGIDLDTNEQSAKSHEAIPSLVRAATPKEDDGIVFLTRDKTIALYHKDTGALSPADIAYPNTNANPSDIFIYNQRLYTLDPVNNQIYKHEKTQTGYDKGTPWIQDTGHTIQNGVSLAIDGDLFVLTADGQIEKFSKGRSVAFPDISVDPRLEAPTKIWTYNGLNNLYILEPKNKRIIVLTKEGKLVQQYTSPTWKNPTGMIADEAKRMLYVVDDNKILSFSF